MSLGFGIGVFALWLEGYTIPLPGLDAAPHADALLPWDGSNRPVEKPNQPVYLRVDVPNDAAPGGYRATVHVTADGRRTDVPVSIRVFDVHLPPPAASPPGVGSRSKRTTSSPRCASLSAVVNPSAPPPRTPLRVKDILSWRKSPHYSTQ